jgi:thiamine-phosphate pyrophosphorylase
MSPTADPNSPPRKSPILCYVTDRKTLPLSSSQNVTECLSNKIAAVAAAGADWIQTREKDLSGKACASLVREAMGRILRIVVEGQGRPRIIVNDRLDVSIATQAGGVHLGGESVPLQEAKRLVLQQQRAQALAADFLIGVSCHSLRAAKSAAAAGASYIFFGPVFATPSKARFGAPQGLGRLAEVCAAVPVPVLAIGGITVENAGSCLASGASGIAAIRLFQDAPDPASVIRAIRQGDSQH